MGTDTTTALATRLARFDRVVEVGVGRRPGVAAALAERGVSVTATDICDRRVPDGVRFVRDDATDPEYRVYAGANALFARNLPPELHRPVRDIARDVDARFLFTTLGAEQPAIPAVPETILGTTLFAAESQPA